jgi:hypothetical protein
MKKILTLVMLALTAMMALPAMAAGPERGVLPQATPEATIASPLPTPTPIALPSATPIVESQPGVEIGDGEGKVVFGGTYTLRSGERLRGDLVVFGGIATLQSDTRVDGNTVLFGGNADIAGRIQGDLVLIGGAARLRSTAVVDGQVVRVGGALTQDQGAQIHGGESGGVIIPPIRPIPPIMPIPTRPRYWAEDFVVHSMSAIGTTFVLALLAVFVFVLWREPIERVNRTITQSPGISWVVGFLTPLAFAVIVPAFAVLSAILILALCLGLVGFVLIAAVSLALVAAWAMGWIAVGQLIGERLLIALGARTVTPAASAAAGTATITLLWLGLEPLCGLGWLFFVVLAPLGLGAVVLTRFGTREYTPTNGTSASAPAVPVAPSAPPAPLAPPAPAAPGPAQPPPVEPIESPAPAADVTSSSEPPVSPLDRPAGES